MKNILLILIIGTLTVGCATTTVEPAPKIKVVTVEKPVIKCPAPPDFSFPRLIIEDLTPEDVNDYGRVVQYWKATLLQLISEIEKRDAALDAYRKMQEEDSNEIQ